MGTLGPDRDASPYRRVRLGAATPCRVVCIHNTPLKGASCGAYLSCGASLWTRVRLFCRADALRSFCRASPCTGFPGRPGCRFTGLPSPVPPAKGALAPLWDPPPGGLNFRGHAGLLDQLEVGWNHTGRRHQGRYPHLHDHWPLQYPSPPAPHSLSATFDCRWNNQASPEHGEDIFCLRETQAVWLGSRSSGPRPVMSVTISQEMPCSRILRASARA